MLGHLKKGLKKPQLGMAEALNIRVRALMAQLPRAIERNIEDKEND